MTNNNKQSEIEKLKAEIERLKKELKKRKKYGLVWEDKLEDVVEMCKKKLPVLKEVKNKEIITDKEKPVNLLIEGDNYHALSVLNYTHAGKVDVIYIDPPYNTGNKDFIFNDHYVDKEDAYRHSKWLSFMEKRLRLARNLLKDTGVIFISIDDNEKYQLKLLCDSIFGESNFVVEITVRTSSINAFKIYGNKPVRIKDYLLVYARNISKYQYNRIYTERKGKWDAHYNLFYDKKNNKLYPLKDILLKEGILREGQKLGSLEIDDPKFKKFYLKFRNNICQTGAYKDSPEKRKSLEHKNKVVKIKSKTGKEIFLYNGRMLSFLSSSIKPINGTGEEGIALALSDIWDDIDYNNIQNESPVAMPNGQKPIKLIQRIIKTYPKQDDILILDFFAGSGTTGHAVLDLNKADNKNRQFILITNNENNVCSEFCYPRIKQVIKGWNKHEGLGGNLKYFKTDFVDAEPTDKNKIKLTKQATEMLCVKEGTFELVQDRGSFKIFKNSKHYTGIIFDQSAIPEFKEAIKDIKGRFRVYIFSLGDETFDEEFQDIKQKVKLSPIPEVILRVYRRIFK